MESDAYFLSGENPSATVDQRDLEERALALLDSGEMQRARKIVTLLWENVAKYPARDQWSRFANAVDEYMFHQALYAANADASDPRILRIMEPAGHWFGRDVPGSRWGGDSPDFIYRIVPVEHGASYRLRGQTTCALPPSVTYSLVASGGAAPSTVNILDSLDMATDESGEFVITIDSSAAGPRRNHLQTKPGVDHLMVRDALGDWLEQTPNRLRVERLDTPSRAPWSADECAQFAARRAVNGFYYTFYCTQSGQGQAPNDLRAPQSSAPFGGMATQWGAKGNLCLEEDEAMIITSNDAGAAFRNVVLHEVFNISLNYWDRTGSLNSEQMARDEDGKYTCVVAHRDPGVHNWLDTGGLRRTIIGLRWQGFPGGGATETPAYTSRVVKFDALDSALAHGVRRIDSAGRREQIDKRLEGFRRRRLDDAFNQDPATGSR